MTGRKTRSFRQKQQQQNRQVARRCREAYLCGRWRLRTRSSKYPSRKGWKQRTRSSGGRLGRTYHSRLVNNGNSSRTPWPILRGIARACLISQATPAIDAGLDRAIHSSGANGTNRSELARTQLEVLYGLGVAAKDRYGSLKAQDRKEFDRAVQYFRKAWGLRAMANTFDRVVFPKALYGWGLALHDRSWIDRDAMHKRKLEYVRAAQDKFSEFLKEVQNGGNAGYPYPR